MGRRSNRWRHQRKDVKTNKGYSGRRAAERAPVRSCRPNLAGLALERRELLTISDFKVAINPQIIYPPNSQYVPITVTGSYKVGPHQGAALANFLVVDEYRLDMPHGDVKSHPVPDEVGRYTFSFQTHLQARVAGGDSDGRLYTIAVSARQPDNAAGQSFGIWVPPQGYHPPKTAVPQAHTALVLSQRGRVRAH